MPQATLPDGFLFSARRRAGWPVAMTVALASLCGSPSAQALRQPDAKWAALTNQYRKLYGQRQYAEATDVAKQALVETERALGAETEPVAQILNDLGYLYQVQGQPAMAQPLHERALAIRGRLDNPETMLVIQSLMNLAKTDEILGRSREAEALFRRALPLLEARLGADHLQVAELLSSLARESIALGRADEVDGLLARAVSIVDAHPGGVYFDVAPMLDLYAARLKQQVNPNEEALARIERIRTAAHHKRLGDVQRMVAQIQAGMTRDEVEAWLPQKDGGLQSPSVGRYYESPEVMVEVPFDQTGGAGSRENRVNGPVKVYRSLLHGD